MNELERGIELTFRVLPEASAFFQPGEGAFHDPAFRNNGKGVQLVTLGHLHCGTKPLLDGLSKRRSVIGAVHQHALDLP